MSFRLQRGKASFFSHVRKSPSIECGNNFSLAGWSIELLIVLPRDVCFKLLGAPIGTTEYCQTLTNKRAVKVQSSLDAIAELPDPQVALALLRSCSSFGKMVFSARATPFNVHQEQLLAFDHSVRRCFEQFTGLHPDDSQWLQATLATKVGGLGLRSLSRHSSAAYLASRSCCDQPVGVTGPSATTWSAMWESVWQPQLAGDLSLRNQICCGLVQVKETGLKKAVKVGKAAKDLRLAVLQIFSFLAGTLAALPP